MYFLQLFSKWQNQFRWIGAIHWWMNARLVVSQQMLGSLMKNSPVVN